MIIQKCNSLTGIRNITQESIVDLKYCGTEYCAHSVRGKLDFRFSGYCPLLFFQHMAKLKSDGLEMVTNIQVAADARESDRRKEQEEACRLRYMQ